VAFAKPQTKSKSQKSRTWKRRRKKGKQAASTKRHPKVDSLARPNGKIENKIEIELILVYANFMAPLMD
jgi:hypothetical protein